MSEANERVVAVPPDFYDELTNNAILADPHNTLHEASMCARDLVQCRVYGLPSIP